MLFVIYSLILFKYFGHSSKKSLVYYPKFLFGFEKGGNYSIKVENCQVDELLLVIATQNEMGKCSTKQLIDNKCNASLSIYHQMKIVNGSGEIKGSIKSKGVYKTKLISMKNYSNQFNIIINYKNPSSYLSYNYNQYLPISKIIAAISCLMLIVWFINWMFYCTTENLVHILFTTTFILFATEKVSYAIELEKCNKSDEKSKIIGIRILAQYLKMYILSVAIMMLEFEIEDTFSFTKHFIPIYIISLILGFVLISQQPIIRNIAFICFFAFYAFALFYMHKDYIPAPNEEHNHTRNPKTFLLFSFYYIVISTFVLDSSSFVVYFPVYLYAGLEITNIFLMILFEYFYRLKSSTIKNYRFIDDKDEVISGIFEEEEDN